MFQNTHEHALLQMYLDRTWVPIHLYACPDAPIPPCKFGYPYTCKQADMPLCLYTSPGAPMLFKVPIPFTCMQAKMFLPVCQLRYHYTCMQDRIPLYHHTSPVAPIPVCKPDCS